MNPESKYPDLVAMKNNEIFIETAYISKLKESDLKNPYSEVVILPVNKIILKKDYSNFTRQLKSDYNAGFVTLVTLEKEIMR